MTLLQCVPKKGSFSIRRKYIIFMCRPCSYSVISGTLDTLTYSIPSIINLNCIYDFCGLKYLLPNFQNPIKAFLLARKYRLFITSFLICLQGSSFIGLPPESYNLFVTSAPQDGVKLWDTRTFKLVFIILLNWYSGLFKFSNQAICLRYPFDPPARKIGRIINDNGT